MEVYLDNSATTRCFPEAAKLMYKVMTEDYGNPSSLHQKGVDAEKYVREAKSEGGAQGDLFYLRWNRE